MRTKPGALQSPGRPLHSGPDESFATSIMSFSKKLVDAIQGNRDLMNAYIAIMLGIGCGMLGCIALNKAMNKHVLATCNTKLNQIVELKTAVGPSYGCISKKVLHGPAYPLKP